MGARPLNSVVRVGVSKTSVPSSILGGGTTVQVGCLCAYYRQEAHTLTFPTPTLTAILGLGVSDSFGAPFEFHTGAPEHAVLSIGEKRYLSCYDDVGQPIRRCRTSGLHTDDTQQSLILLWVWSQMLTKGKDPLQSGTVAELFIRVCQRMASERVDPRGHSFGVHRGTGRNFRDAIVHRKDGPPMTAGLGAAMRIGPVATLLPTPESVIPWVVEVSASTTSDPVAQAAAAMFALACWYEAYPEQEVYPDVPPDIRDAWQLLMLARHHLDAKGEDGLLQFASNHTTENLRCAAGGFALTGVPWVLKCVNDATSFEDALLRVCASGGDTDTVCAMAGCLAALKFGRTSIPEWMVEGLVGKDFLLDPTLWHPVASERPYVGMDVELQSGLERRVREEARLRKVTPATPTEET